MNELGEYFVILAQAMFVPSRGAKNYIIWHEDGKITTKGSWRKRDRSRLQKEFPLNYLTQYLLSKVKRMFEKWYSVIFITLLPPLVPPCKAGHFHSRG
jgi:hypothetical protein